MSWPEHMEPALQEYITERQNAALRAYEADPTLIQEHVGQEDSFRAGGYGTRQISELLQNAVDAVTAAGNGGAVEFRLADGALYCANEGEGFSVDGIKAVTYAFLSAKRGEEIGRFGLGFKSVLGITDHPQIFSHGVSFEFNSPETAELFADLPMSGGPLPLLRMPSVVDPFQAATEDPNLAEMMTWATTVIKLPIIRDYPRLLKELSEFKSTSLLFFKGIDRLRVSVRLSPGADLVAQEFRREGNHDEGDIRILNSDGDSTRWLYAERRYSPSESVLSGLRATARRQSMTVSYALAPDGRADVGQLWAWFPLLDRTTASGIFNAPWEVNDDRTSLVPGSALNRELLGVAADLFLDVAYRLSTPADPARHFDAFPARGKETRSNADAFLTEQIPERARQRATIPDATGVLKVSTYFKHVPDLEKTPVSSRAMEIWQQHSSRQTIPHSSCFTSATRRSRLRTLLGGSAEDRSAQETTVGAWLTEVAREGLLGNIAALDILLALREPHPDAYRAGLAAEIIPTDEKVFRADATDRVLIPVDGTPVPDGVLTVREELAKGAGSRLRDLGFRQVSGDQAAAALAAGATENWTDSDWERLWGALGSAAPSRAAEAIASIRDRGVEVRIRTQDGMWRPARRVLTDAQIASNIPELQVDRGLVPNTALREAAGTVSAPQSGCDHTRDALWTAYAAEAEDRVRRKIAEAGQSPTHVVIPDGIGVGPVDILQFDLTDMDRARWSQQLIMNLGATATVIEAPLVTRQKAGVEVPSFEWWALANYGLVMSSQGFRRPNAVIGGSLQRFAKMLPVVSGDLPGLPIAHTPAKISTSMLRGFLDMDGLVLTEQDSSAFVELLNLCANRDDIPRPALVPAIVQGRIVKCPVSHVAVSDSVNQERDLNDAEVPFIPARGDSGPLLEKWGLMRAEDALQQSIEVTGRQEATPLLDLYPSLDQVLSAERRKTLVARAARIERVMQSASGTRRKLLQSSKEERTVVVTDSLDHVAMLHAISRELTLGLSATDVTDILKRDDDLRRSAVIANAQAAKSDKERLLILVGEHVLRERLPDGLLAAVEQTRGPLEAVDVSDLFLNVYGRDAVREIREDLKRNRVPVPDFWDGRPSTQAAVKALGFDTSYAGTSTRRPGPVTLVPGQVDLKPLHDYQEEVAAKIGDLARGIGSDARRGLLYLPTGAGKTRVTVEAILKLMISGEVHSPLLWIAQSEELCEQAITAFAEVWRWLGDERALDISRFWSGYEVDESTEELQVVVAIDATLNSRFGEAHYEWLTNPGMVVIDEAHTALSKTYTEILRHLGITSNHAARPLLGLTATPFRGRNDETNRLFAMRFGGNRLEPSDFDEADGITRLREMNVLAEVDYALLKGAEVSVHDQDAEFLRMKEVTPTMLTSIGQNMERTKTVIDHIKQQPSDWPILVFAASVASAHTIAALLRVEGINADSVDGGMRRNERRRVIDQFKSGEVQVLVNCDLLTQGFDAPQVRALYIARPTFSPNRYIQMVGRGLRGPANGGTDRCLIVNVEDTFEQFGENLAYNEFDYLWNEES